MVLWRQAIAQVLTHGPAQASLDNFIPDGHKVWEWRVEETGGRLYHQIGDQVEVYGHVWQGPLHAYPYQLFWQDAGGNGHSEGGHAGHSEGLLSCNIPSPADPSSRLS